MAQHTTPKLRFPEFSGAWEEKELKSVSEKISDGIHSTPVYDEDGEYYFVNGNNFVGDKITFFPTTKKVNRGEYLKHKKNLNDKTILMSINGTIGNLARYNLEPIILGKSACYINVSQANSDFIYYVLQTNGTKNYFDSELTGSTIKNLSLNTIKSLTINFPTLPEQQKIASFLSAADKKLEQLQQKKTLLEQYKKGMMQKLFSQQIRFKDDGGKDFPEWEEKELGEVGFFQTSSVDKLSKDDENEVYLVNYMDVYNHKLITNINKISLQRVTAKNSQIVSSNLKKGDILFTPSSETPDDIGHSIVVCEDLENTVYSYHVIRFRPKVTLDLSYSHYFCNVPSVLNQLSKYATGSTRFTISTGNFAKVKVQIPSLAEQTKIAEFLTAIDAKIAAVNAQVAAAKGFKKGLLQQMFV